MTDPRCHGVVTPAESARGTGDLEVTGGCEIRESAPDVLRLVVTGRIAPKGSRTAGVRRDGSRYSRPASRHEHAFTEAVAREALACSSSGRAAPPFRVGLTFLFARPARPAVPWPSRLDVDKAARAVLDGLVRGGVLTDDRHVVELVASKGWSDGAERVVVDVSTIEEVAAVATTSKPRPRPGPFPAPVPGTPEAPDPLPSPLPPGIAARHLMQYDHEGRA